MQKGKNISGDSSAIEVRSYNHGDWVVHEGDRRRLFYVILEGVVRILVKGKIIRILSEGDVFGMESIFLKKPINFSAKVVESARVAIYGPQAAEYFLYQHPQIAERIILSILKQLETTTAVAGGERKISIEDPRLKFFEDKDVIIEEGTVGTDIYKLVFSEGGLRVSKQGQEIAWIRDPGEFFGEMASILRERRTATITSVGKSIVQVYSGEDIEDLFEEHPEMAKKMIFTLANRLEEANVRMIGVTE